MQINDELRQSLAVKGSEIERRKKEESELKERVKFLQGIVEEGQNYVINSPGGDVTQRCEDDQANKDITQLKSQLNESNKMNSTLKDQVEELNAKIKRVDAHYEEIINDKDAAMKEYFSILENDSNEKVNLRRLLIKFRSESELKLIQELKSALDKSEVKGSHDHENEDMPKLEDDGAELGTDNCITNEDGNAVQQSGGKKGLCRDGRKCALKASCGYRHELINKPCR